MAQFDDQRGPRRGNISAAGRWHRSASWTKPLASGNIGHHEATEKIRQRQYPSGRQIALSELWAVSSCQVPPRDAGNDAGCACLPRVPGVYPRQDAAKSPLTHLPNFTFLFRKKCRTINADRILSMSNPGRIPFFISATSLLLTASLSAQHNFGRDHHVFHRMSGQSKHSAGQNAAGNSARTHPSTATASNRPAKPVPAGTNPGH